MKKRGRFGGGNGGLWMIQKLRKVTAPRIEERFLHREEEPLSVPCSEIRGHRYGNPDDIGYLNRFEDEDDPGATPQKVVIATDDTKQPPRNLGVKRGIFGSRTQTLLTDSEISKKIRVTLSQSSVSQVSSDDEDHSQRKLAIDASDDDEEEEASFSVLRKVLNHPGKEDVSSHDCSNSHLTFDDEAKESFTRNNHSEEIHPSLEAARAFFAELDNAPLVMEDASRNPSAKKNYKLRTRRCKLPQQMLQSEYAKYCDACGQSVKPLSIQHFVEQRARYFRRSEVFEGMFDE